MSRRRVESLLTLARGDARAAHRLLPDFPRHAAFHVEQAAEKLVLAVIEAEDRGPVERAHQHQINRLVGYLPMDHVLYADLQALDRTTPYATQLRYPSPGGALTHPPEASDLIDLLNDLDGLLDDVADHCRAVLADGG